MSRLSILAGLFVAQLSLSATPAAAIVNGDAIAYGTAGVYRLGNGCSSVALSKRWLLTANHCVNAASTANPALNTVDLGNGITAMGEKVVRHPEGTHLPGKQFDVALIRIDRDIPRETFPGFSLVSRDDRIGTTVHCTGYGVPGGGVLRSGAIPVDRAETKNPHRVVLLPNAKGQITAPGDSGSPCFTDASRTEIATLTSSGPTAAPWTHANHHYARSFAAWATKAVNWEPLPGRAREIAAGDGGHVVITGQSKAGADGHSVYRWTGSGWAKQPFAAEKIAVASDGTIWMATANGTIRRSQGTGYQTLPGKAAEIAARGGQVFVLGASTLAGGGRKLYRWTGAGWTQVTPPPGGAFSLSLDQNGNPWVTGPDGRIRFGIGTGASLSWTLSSGKATDQDMAHKAWALGLTKLSDGGQGIWRWDGRWTRIKGLGARRIAAGHDGRAWVIGADLRIYRFGAE